MTTQFELTKAGLVKAHVWANPTTKHIFTPNRTAYGYNMEYSGEFRDLYMGAKTTTVYKGGRFRFFVSAAQMEALGFVFVERGKSPLW